MCMSVSKILFFRLIRLRTSMNDEEDASMKELFESINSILAFVGPLSDFFGISRLTLPGIRQSLF